jgi:hypothetical protein
MPFNGSGQFVRVHNWTSDAANGIDINATEMDAEDNGFAAGLSNCVTRDGQGRMAADFLPSVGNTFNLGTAALPWATLNGINIESLPVTQAAVGELLYPQDAQEITLTITPTLIYYPYGNPYRYGAAGNGTTNDYTAVSDADKVSAAMGQVLVMPGGTFNMGTSYTFTSPVKMSGAIFTGTGTVSFPVGFDAPCYYCFDCLVGAIRAPFVFAEWFGAQQSQTATPTAGGTYIAPTSITAKAWNTWPSFIVGSNYHVNQNYGNAAYLAANTPFANADTWDFIAIQRAVWVAQATGAEVRLLPAQYYLTRSVRQVTDNPATVRGAGRTQTGVHMNNTATYEVITDLSINASCRVIFDFYGAGGTPCIISDIGFFGYSTYGTGLNLIGVAKSTSNGVVITNCWYSTLDYGDYNDQSSSDNELHCCEMEFVLTMVELYDAPTWIKVNGCSFFHSGSGTFYGINCTNGGYAFVKDCLFVRINYPFGIQFGVSGTPQGLGLGSHVTGTTLISSNGQTRIDGRQIMTRQVVPAATTLSIVGIVMAATSAITTRFRAGGVVAGVGSAGIYNEASWSVDGGANPVGTVIVASTQWGNGTAKLLITAPTTLSAETLALQIDNTGTGSQSYTCDASITIEGNDCIWTVYNTT